MSGNHITPRTGLTNEAVLSSAQQRLWFLDHLQPHGADLNIFCAYSLVGPFDAELLDRCLAEIARRHETLRTTFNMVNGNVVQTISQEGRIDISLKDLRWLPKFERDKEMMRLIASEAKRSFDLAHGPLLHVSLLRLAEEEHILVVVMHHIISDTSSMRILFRELSLLYELLATANDMPLPTLPIQYADYATWQRQRLEARVLDRHLEYWKHQLAGVPAVLALPTDRPRTAVQSFQGARQSLNIPSSVFRSLTALSKHQGTTLFVTLLAAFQALLYRYTGETDIVVGTPLLRRSTTDIEGLIGLFTDTLVLRGDLSNNPTFPEILRRTQEVVLLAFAHRDLPFEQLIEELESERNLSHAPIFQVMFAVQTMPTAVFSLPGVVVQLLEIDTTTISDLSLDLITTPNRLSGTIDYNAALFDAATITRLAGHFQTLLKGIVADPVQRLTDLPLLSSAERRKVLVDWNAMKTGYRQDQTICQLFEAQASRTPAAIVVTDENRHLTYQELNEQANQLAHHLRTLGVGPETLVGVCVERSVEMMIGLLGILKAGGAYVPLDPTYPQERLAFMLADSSASVLITQAKLATELPAYDGIVICLDTDWPRIGCESRYNLKSRSLSGGLAYVIYTSGSTGTPKGVMVTHNSLVNLLSAMRKQLKVNPEVTLVSTTNLSFDMIVPDLFLPIVVGARLLLVSREVVSDYTRISEQLAQIGTSIMQATPSIWRLLLEAEWGGSGDLTIVCGGEAVPRELAKRLFERATTLWLFYGPTETTVWSTAHQVKSQCELICIGKPIANTEVYVLDSSMNPVPVMVVGELYIGGAGVTRGYFHRPGLTAEKFVPHPFSQAPGVRLFRTGDLARYLPSGDLEFIGRIDQQVKVRGYRIELGEVEMVLRQHPAVLEAAVLVREDVPGDKQLVAYIVPNDRAEPVTSEVRHHMQTKLPDYMVPTAFVFLDALPLTPNGKVNRKKLPALNRIRPESEERYGAPRTPLEDKLAKLWSQVLGVERVGVHDNFFELGGDSIHSIQISARAKQLGIRLASRQILQHQTIANLAAIVGDQPNV